MRYQTLTLRKKFVIGGVLAALCGVLLPVGVVLATDAYYTDIIFSYDEEKNLTMTFEAVQTFYIHYTEWVGHGGACIYDDPRGQSGSADWGATGMHFDNARFFLDAGTCNTTSTYTAGQTYTVYFIDAPVFLAESITATTTEATVKTFFENWEDDTTIDEESLITLRYRDEDGNWQDQIQGTWFAEPPNITIDFPADSAEMAASFTMLVDYDKATGYDRLMIIFEEWNASSACPTYGTEEWDAEVALGYFEYQSLPYFSPLFTTSTGTTSVEVDALNTGSYNCVKCFYVNESTGGLTDALCWGYDLDIISYIPPAYLPSYYLPIESWDDYYAEHSERFGTSTPLFENWAGTFEPLITWVGNTILFFQDYFDPDVARMRGEEMGTAVASARGYLENIDDFFGGLPLSTIFIFYLITALVIIVYRIVKGILTIIVP